MIKAVRITDGNDRMATREEIFEEDSGRTLGHITSFDLDLWSAYVLVPVDDEHKNGKHVVSGIEGRQAAIDLVVMMHAYWTLPAHEKEKDA